MASQETDRVDFDVIVVGAGVAGSTCAYQLAIQGRSVLLVERGSAAGTKNLSGGVLYCRVMEQVFPGFVSRAPVERVVTRNCITFLSPTSSVGIDYWDQRLGEPENAVTVLRSRLDAWLCEQCEDAGVMVMPGVKVDHLIVEGGRVVGIRAGEDELRARIVVLADGVNSFLARDAGIREREPMNHLAVGVKSVIALPQEVIEQRFNLTGDEGVAYALVGDCTQSIAGGGFLYTNRESVSIGVVLRLDSLADSGLSSSDVHDHFLEHPSIAPLLAGGELAEYGCHLTIEAGPAMAAHDIAGPGLLIVGDAAGFTLNTGLTIRGMDLAAGSAIAAASAAGRALDSGEVGQPMVSAYQAELKRSFVGADMCTYAKAPAFLERQAMYGDVGDLLGDVMHSLFNLDTSPREHIVTSARKALKNSPLTVPGLGGIGLAAVRAL